LTLFVVFLFLAIYNAGCMTTLQLQHYGIYPAVGREGFADYMKANNRAAALPTILPAMLLLFSSIALGIFRPEFVAPHEENLAFVLNMIAFTSTIKWQRKLQGEMAESGYDEDKVRLLIRTNWIRTISHWLIAGIAITILVRVMRTQVGALP
jgi:hypothetical protein